MMATKLNWLNNALNVELLNQNIHLSLGIVLVTYYRSREYLFSEYDNKDDKMIL